MEENISRAATFEDFKKIIRSLNEQKAPYVLIGGYALYPHGIYRATTDIDILVPSTKDAWEKIVKALLILPDQSAKDIDFKWFEEKETIRLADEVVVDILFNAASKSYDELLQYMEVIEIDNIPVRTLNLEGLLFTKQTPRDKDVADKEILQKAIEKTRLRNNI